MARLNDEEKILLFNKNHVDWAKLNVNFLMFVAVNRATSKVDANNCSKRLSAAKLSLLDLFQKAYDPQSVQGDHNRTMRWRSALRVIGIDFMRIIEEGLFKTRTKTLLQSISDVLNKDLKPLDEEHANTIYYVAGAMMKPMEKLEH